MKKPLLIGLYLVNLGIILYFWWVGSGGLLTSNAVGFRLAAARLVGLLGMFSILTQYVLISNAPWVNKIIGQYKLTNLHMQNGKLAFILIVTHVILIRSVFGKPLVLPYVWLAAIAFSILVATVGTAILQKRLPYKVWHGIHLLNYTVAALAIWHQLANGGDFLINSFFRGYWIVITVLAMLNLLYFRVAKPLWLKSQSKTTP